MAFNYALDKLSGLEVEGLPSFQESNQIVFFRNDPKHVVTETYLQSSLKPDIVLARWNFFNRMRKTPNTPYWRSYKSDLCCKAMFRISWRNILSTLEVKRSSSKASEGGKRTSVDKLWIGGKFGGYTGDFDGLGRDFQVAGPSSGPSLSAPREIVREGYSNRRRTSIFHTHPALHSH